MIHRTTLITVILLLGLTQIGYPQSEEKPPREYTNPQELISFDRKTSFPDAIEVLSQYAQDYEDRFIIDRSGTTGAIGVSLPAMHWKDALNYILRVQNLVVLESPEILEIVTESEAQEILGEDSGGTTDRGQGTDMEGIEISTQTREVRINATFFEGNKRALQEIGVDWSTISNNIPENLSDYVTDDGDGQLPDQEFDGRFVSVNSRGAQNVSQSVFNSIINFGEVGGGIEVQALFSAFEADNLGEILATPSVKVMDGEEGRIQVGQDFSIKQRDFAGNVTDQFFSTGTILLVRPQIVEIDDTTLIYLDLEAERSSAQPDPVSTIINKQQANTHALLLDGESTVIAGLYRTEESKIRRGIPILKDLPGWFFGLKYLFGYNSTDVQESELVVLLQAELEDSIDDRLERAYKSKKDLLAEKKERHRNDMDYISNKSPVDPYPAPEPSVDRTGLEMSNSDDEFSENTLNEVATGREVIEMKNIDLSEIRPASSFAGLKQGNISRKNVSEIAKEWRAMELENVNGDHENYDFYVIGGSFINRSNADRLYESYKNEELDAHMLFNPVTDYYFVAYKGFETPENAYQYVVDIQENRQPEAWVSRLIRKERRLDLNGADTHQEKQQSQAGD